MGTVKDWIERRKNPRKFARVDLQFRMRGLEVDVLKKALKLFISNAEKATERDIIKDLLGLIEYQEQNQKE